MFAVIIKQEWRLILNNSTNIINPIIFFFIIISIFAIVFDDPSFNNSNSAIGLIWFSLIFAILFANQNSFKEDFSDGTIEQLLISGDNFALIIATKLFAGWLIYTAPLIASIPIAALILKLDNQLILNLIIIAILASLLISLIANFCSSLILSINFNASLLTILFLPLIIPIIIFANSAFIGASAASFYLALKFLAAILIFSAPILIWAISAAIRLNME